jgi:hypothetical protein
MLYAIKVTYTAPDGSVTVTVYKKRYKTFLRANKTAQAQFRWVTCPDGVTITERSSAEVIEVPE